jgi:hypothetical protein
MRLENIAYSRDAVALLLAEYFAPFIRIACVHRPWQDPGQIIPTEPGGGRLRPGMEPSREKALRVLRPGGRAKAPKFAPRTTGPAPETGPSSGLGKLQPLTECQPDITCRLASKV